MKKTIISIAGITQGVGVTNLALSYATFLKNAYSGRVCIVDLSHSGYSFLNDGRHPLLDGGFLLNHIAIYPDGNSDTLTSLYHSDYEYIILDIGNELKAYMLDFKRSDVQIIIMDLSLLKKHISYAFLSLNSSLITDTHTAYYYSFGTEKEAKKMSHLIHKKIVRVPTEWDPMKIQSCNFRFYETITKAVVR